MNATTTDTSSLVTLEEVFGNAEPCDKVTITVPGTGGLVHHVFTLGWDDERWHQGTVDIDGFTADAIWEAFEKVRDDKGATIHRGGPDLSPFSHGRTLPKS